MRGRVGWIVAVGLLIIGVAAIAVYGQLTSFEFEQVTDDVHVIYGLGGNVGVLGTEQGTIVVDTMTLNLQGKQIREQAQRIAGAPVTTIINTHYHTDHTHGNPGFPMGIKVVSTERTLAYLLDRDGDYWRGDTGATLPNETFRDNHTLRIGGKTIRLYHLGRGHTDGDLVVIFAEDRVLHTGDLYFNGRYPNIDLEAGGSVQEWGATIDRILELDFDKVIPGHGPVTDRAGLIAFQRFVRELASVAAKAAAAGQSLDETLTSATLREDEGYEAMYIPLIMNLDRDFVIRRAWEEATGAVKPSPPPDSR